MRKAIALIPARLGSTRFPGKVLAAETGRPLIRHVVDAAARAALVERVVVATDDQRVHDAVAAFGGQVVMTSNAHHNGTSRLAEAAAVLGLDDEALVVNVQGDEPEIEGGVIDAAVESLLASGADVSTVASPFREDEDPADPNIVKVVLRRDSTAMYFSRSLVPHARPGGVPAAPLKHIGLYAYRAAFLHRYATLVETPLEQSEMLEQLRVLEHGYRVAVAVREVHTTGIDTPEQYRAFVARWHRRG